ncbi:hypothetical protein U14_00663 [Candidatus Moduliflexus flocculans]|uniref:Type II toxin-antitoxin system MqsA family antitoxin n=1 Tax=Candidatus Moduliflexus flocculans TaxID=1499966 RepID=A0A0S6VVQ8_9BACT|nr:hypothetical protein U14_00663 [Candidatus Moduliflexus flocculans]
MKCVFCGGQLKRAAVTFTYEERGRYMFVEHVPADICEQCGEKLYSPEVADALLALAKQKTAPPKIVSVPVYDYSLMLSAA